jgi:putative N-acetylmannosamine-6-phosphate epimerase
LNRGIIVSIQGYSQDTIKELALDAINAGSVAIRTDKPVRIAMDKKVPIIGLHKIKVNNQVMESYITPTIQDIEIVARWADYIAIDYRKLNSSLQDLSDYCHANNLKVVADISDWEDYENIIAKKLYFHFITTALTVFRKQYWPDIKLAIKLAKAEPKRIIAEGNYRNRDDVQKVLNAGVYAVCIGAAISNVYKLTRRYTTIEIGKNG